MSRLSGVLLVVWCAGAGLDDARAAVCAGTPWLRMSVEPAAIQGADIVSSIAVHDDGCVAIHQPAFRVDAGQWRVQLDGASLSALKRLVQSQRLATLDLTQVWPALRRTAAADSSAPQFAVLDGDRYQFELRERGPDDVIRVEALRQYAEQYPASAELNGLQAVATRLRTLTYGNAQRVSAGAAP